MSSNSKLRKDAAVQICCLSARGRNLVGTHRDSTSNTMRSVPERSEPLV
jgi:hypothetical protein